MMQNSSGYFFLVAGFAVSLFWFALHLLDKRNWYIDLSLILSLSSFMAWGLTSFHKKFKEKTYIINYLNDALFAAYLFLVLYETNMSPMLSIAGVLYFCISFSTIPHLKYLIANSIAMFLIAILVLPEGVNPEIKWFFTLSILVVASVSIIQFKNRLKVLNLLYENYHRFQKISEGNFGGILIFSKNQVLETNSTFRHMFHLQSHIEPESIDVIDLVGAEAYKTFSAFQESSEKESTMTAEIQISGKFREPFCVEYKLKKINLLDEEVNALFIQDISEMKNSKSIINKQASTLVKVSRLSDLGELSAGIAHEINNPLAIITGMADEILYKLEMDKNINKGDLQFLANRIIQNTERISKIIKGLKNFARDGSHDPFKPDNILDLLQESLNICQMAFAKQNINIELINFDQTAPLLVKCRAVQIEQVLVNILNNAKDALKVVEKPNIEIELDYNKDWVEIHISDNGKGISKSLKKKVFESYFTTKAPGIGTGLGLSIAKQIIDAHQGKIHLSSTKKRTTFTIQLPRYYQSPKIEKVS